MSAFHRIVLYLIALLSATARSRAEAGVSLVTLADLQALALRNHPAGLEAEALQRIGTAEISVAKTWEDPVVEGSIGRGTPKPEGPSGQEWSYEVGQNLPSPIAYRHRIQSAEFGAQERNAEAAARRLDLEIAVEALFYEYSSASEAASLLKQTAEGAERVLALTTRRVELGEGRENERLRAEVELLRVRRAYAAASREAEVSRESLRRIVGPGIPETFDVAPQWPSLAATPALEDLRSKAEAANPELLAARARVSESGEASLAASWAAWPDLAASYYRTDEIDKNSHGVRLGLRVPLWNANRPEAARRKAEASFLRAELAQLEIDLGNELIRAHGELRVAAEQTDQFATRLLPTARESLRLAELTYSEGEASFLELLDAQRTYRETASELIEVRRDAARALTTLHRLTGGAHAANSR